MTESELIDLLASGAILFLPKRKGYIVNHLNDKNREYFIIQTGISYIESNYYCWYSELEKTSAFDNFEVLSKQEFDNLMLLEKIL